MQETSVLSVILTKLGSTFSQADVFMSFTHKPSWVWVVEHRKRRNWCFPPGSPWRRPLLWGVPAVGCRRPSPIWPSASVSWWAPGSRASFHEPDAFMMRSWGPAWGKPWQEDFWVQTLPFRFRPVPFSTLCSHLDFRLCVFKLRSGEQHVRASPQIDIRDCKLVLLWPRTAKTMWDLMSLDVQMNLNASWMMLTCSRCSSFIRFAWLFGLFPSEI